MRAPQMTLSITQHHGVTIRVSRTIRQPSPTESPACTSFITMAGQELLGWASAGDMQLARAVIDACWSSQGHPIDARNTWIVHNREEVVAALLGASAAQWSQDERRAPVSLDHIGPRTITHPMLARFMIQRTVRPEMPASWWYLSSIAVAKVHRRRGFARLLLKHAESLALENGCDGVVLEVVTANQAAVDMYDSLGYTHDLEWCAPTGPPVRRLKKALTK